MKTKYNILFVLCAVVTFTLTSCTDLLNEKPVSYYATENFFTNPANVNLAILGIYDTMERLTSYGSNEISMSTSDDMYIVSGTNNDNGARDISHYNVTATNSNLTTVWNDKYQGIDRANFAIDNIQKMSKANAKDSALLTRYEGEARFLRALLSYDLVKYWGDVPYKTNSTASIGDAYIGRVDRELIYDQIVSDLNLAKTQLPWASDMSVKTPERASSGAARALLMRVLLSRAGYRLNLDGTLTRPDDEKRTAYFNAIIDEYNAFLVNGKHGLFSSYYTFFKNNSAGILDTKESLFEIAFFTANGGPDNAGFWGTYIGPSTDAKSPFGRANAFMRVVPEWDKYYEATDIRRITNIAKFSINATGDSIPVAATNSWYPGKWRRSWTTGTAKDPNDTDINYCLMRYADVLLMVAEALNEVGRTSEAIFTLNLVRARSKVTLLSADFSNYATIYKSPKVKNITYIDDSNDQGKFRTVLYWERGFELCYEGTRKCDLIRWGILDAAIKNTTTQLGSGYAAKSNFVSGKNELFPIPQNEMDVNPKLFQKNNNGYN